MCSRNDYIKGLYVFNCNEYLSLGLPDHNCQEEDALALPLHGQDCCLHWTPCWTLESSPLLSLTVRNLQCHLCQKIGPVRHHFLSLSSTKTVCPKSKVAWMTGGHSLVTLLEDGGTRTHMEFGLWRGLMHPRDGGGAFLTHRVFKRW